MPTHTLCVPMSPCTCQVYLISEPALLLVKVHTLTLSHIPSASTTATTQQIQSTYTDSKQHLSLKDVKICSNALKPQKQLNPDSNLKELLWNYINVHVLYRNGLFRNHRMVQFSQSEASYLRTGGSKLFCRLKPYCQHVLFWHFWESAFLLPVLL